MLHLVPTAGPAVPVIDRVRRGLWSLLRRDRSAPPAPPRPYGSPYADPYAAPYAHDLAGQEDPPPPTVTALYHAHRLRMVRLAVLLVDDLSTAEDVVQDAFTALYDPRGGSERPIATSGRS